MTHSLKLPTVTSSSPLLQNKEPYFSKTLFLENKATKVLENRSEDKTNKGVFEFMVNTKRNRLQIKGNVNIYIRLKVVEGLAL